jgi:hypothetical protein
MQGCCLYVIGAQESRSKPVCRDWKCDLWFKRKRSCQLRCQLPGAGLLCHARVANAFHHPRKGKLAARRGRKAMGHSHCCGWQPGCRRDGQGEEPVRPRTSHPTPLWGVRQTRGSACGLRHGPAPALFPTASCRAKKATGGLRVLSIRNPPAVVDSAITSVP